MLPRPRFSSFDVPNARPDSIQNEDPEVATGHFGSGEEVYASDDVDAVGCRV